MSVLSKIEDLVMKELEGYSKMSSLSNQQVELVDHLTHTLKSIHCIKDKSEGTIASTEMSDSEKLGKIEELLKMFK